MAAATYATDAARAYNKVDPASAIRAHLKAITHLAGTGRLAAAAAEQLDVAEIYEEDGASYDAAVALSNAADYYVAEAMLAQAVHCLKRAGAHLVDEERYSDAHERFDRAANLCLDDNLLKFNAPPISLDAALCLLCLRDDERTVKYLKDVSEKDLNFVVSREKRFLLDLVLCAQEGRLDDLVDHMWNYDYAVELEPHELSMLRVVFTVVEASVHTSSADAQAAQAEEEDASEDSWDEDSSGDEDEDEGGGGAASSRRSRKSQKKKKKKSKKAKKSKGGKKSKKAKGGVSAGDSLLSDDGDASDGSGSVGSGRTGYTGATGVTGTTGLTGTTGAASGAGR